MPTGSIAKNSATTRKMPKMHIASQLRAPAVKLAFIASSGFMS